MLILASQSPRRIEVLKQITTDFVVIPSNIEEVFIESDSPLDRCRDIAFQKGFAIHTSHLEDVVISADTIVVYKNQMIGKPKDKEDAKRILSLLSGHKHKVITAYCIFTTKKVYRNAVISSVEFNNLSEDTIEAYIASGSPMDKAGAYGLQDNDKFNIVKKIKGSSSNVIGFPIDQIKRDLIKNKLI